MRCTSSGRSKWTAVWTLSGGDGLALVGAGVRELHPHPQPSRAVVHEGVHDGHALDVMRVSGCTCFRTLLWSRRRGKIEIPALELLLELYYHHFT